MIKLLDICIAWHKKLMVKILAVYDALRSTQRAAIRHEINAVVEAIHTLDRTRLQLEERKESLEEMLKKD